MNQQERLSQICRCMDELERLRISASSGQWKKMGSLMDVQVGELDWLAELHHWLYDHSTTAVR